MGKTTNKKVVKKVVAKKGAKETWKQQHQHLFLKTPKNFGIGQSIQPTRDLSRYVKWPVYIRIQRQRAVLQKRLKVPPVINQFTRTLEKNAATNVFRLLSQYRPEDKATKKLRLAKAAAADGKVETTKPMVVKFGLNHVTTLVENKKAKLVVIAHDVDPIELVIWLPALCRKMNVPYVIVKGKARLGHLVHQKTAAAVCITAVKKEDNNKLAQIVDAAKLMYDGSERKTWGGGVMGVKNQAVMLKRAKALAAAQKV